MKVPFLSKEELLKKTIVETRPNKEYKFGYMITEDELNVKFLKDESLFNLLLILKPKDREILINTPEAFKVAGAKLLSGEEGVVLPSGTKVPFSKWANILLQVMREHANEYLGMVLVWLKNNDYEEYKIFTAKWDSLKTDEERKDFLDNYASMVTKSIPKEVREQITDEIIIQSILQSEEDNEEVLNVLNSTNLESPFDEVVIKHYMKTKKDLIEGSEVYTHIKVLDRSKNLVSMAQYVCSKSFPWTMCSCGIYNIGHTAESIITAIRRSSKTTDIDERISKIDNNNLLNTRLPFDYASFIYAWYKCLRNRKTEIREVTAKAKTEDNKNLPVTKREYIKGATFENRRVITLGGNIILYTKDEEIIRHVKKKHVTWHIDSFERRGGECRYHRKDGSILIYSRRGAVVRPKKNGKEIQNSVTYVIK